MLEGEDVRFMIYLFTLLFLLVSITKVLILLLNFGSREMAGSLQTGFGLMMMCEERRGPIYYIYLFILALSSLSSITKARRYCSCTLRVAGWLVRSRPVLNFIMRQEWEEVQFIIYIYLFRLFHPFRESPKLGNTAPGLWESRDGWFAPDRFWTSSWCWKEKRSNLLYIIIYFTSFSLASITKV